MAKLTLSDIGAGGLGAATLINTNNGLLETALENTLSRDGTTPNQMEANLDLNSNRVTNLADGVNNQDAVTVAQLTGASPVGVTTLGALTDVADATATNRNVLVADGTDWYSRALVEADISDLGAYVTAAHTHTESDITDLGDYLSASGAGTANGQITFAVDPIVQGSFTNGVAVRLDELTDTEVSIRFGNSVDDQYFGLDADSDFAMGITPSLGNKFWHTGNDGTGSGLDADTVDGIEGSNLMTFAGAQIPDLEDLGNMNLDVASPSDDDVLYYSSGTGDWRANNLTTIVNVVGQAEAEAGTSTVHRFWTAQRVAQAIAALAPTDADTLDTLNSTQFLRSDTSDTFSGTLTASGADINLADNELIRPHIQDYAIVHSTVSLSSNAGTLNYATAQSWLLDLQSASGTVTLTFSNPPASGRYGQMTLEVIQGSTARTITWPGSVTWPGGVAPTLSTGNNDVDLFEFSTRDGGTTWRGTYVQGMG